MPPDTQDVVITIESVSWRLGLPQRDICEAVGVSWSTYRAWLGPGVHRPSVASQWRLRTLVQFTEDLEELLDVRPGLWLRAEPGRRAQFLDGRFDDLLESLRARPRPSQAAPDAARFLSVGGDRLASDGEPAALRRRPRKPTSAQTVSHSRRCKE
jgi:hypothetical protein